MGHCHHHLASREDRIARPQIEEGAGIVDPREAEQVGVVGCARPLDRGVGARGHASGGQSKTCSKRRRGVGETRDGGDGDHY